MLIELHDPKLLTEHGGYGVVDLDDLSLLFSAVMP